MKDFKREAEQIFIDWFKEAFTEGLCSADENMLTDSIESALIKADAEGFKRGRENAFKDSALIVSAQIGMQKTLEDAYRIIMGQIKA